jgi:hypothetical protein
MADINAIKERALKGRLHWVDCAGFRLQVERPTELAWYAFQSAFRGEGEELTGDRALRAFRRAGQFVRDWEGVTFGDIFPADALKDDEIEAAAPFDAELLDYFLQDNPEAAGALFQEVQRLYIEHRQAEAESKKKPEPGSTSPDGSEKPEKPATS